MADERKRAAFRKTDFIIRQTKDDGFSQIDSFKVTAKKLQGKITLNPVENLCSCLHFSWRWSGNHNAEEFSIDASAQSQPP